MSYMWSIHTTGKVKAHQAQSLDQHRVLSSVRSECEACDLKRSPAELLQELRSAPPGIPRGHDIICKDIEIHIIIIFQTSHM